MTHSSAIVGCVIATCISDIGIPDQLCAQDCVQAHPSGLAAFGAFWMGLSPGCVSSHCGAECPF